MMETDRCPNCGNIKSLTPIYKCSDCGNIYCLECFSSEYRGPFEKCGEGRFHCSDPTCNGCSITIGNIKYNPDD